MQWRPRLAMACLGAELRPIAIGSAVIDILRATRQVMVPVIGRQPEVRQVMTAPPKKKTPAPGAGVKADDGASPLARKQIRIDSDTEVLLAAVGDGNLSLGIREAARRLVEHADLAPFDLNRHHARSVNKD